MANITLRGVKGSPLTNQEVDDNFSNLDVRATNLDSSKLDITGGTISGNLTVEGDFTVTGNVTTIGANNLIVNDNFIYLENGNVVNIDFGIVGNYNDGTYAHAGVFRDASDGVFKFFDSYTPEVDSNVNINTDDPSFSLADLSVKDFSANSLTVLSSELVSNLNSQFLDSQPASYYLDWTNTTNKPDPTITINITGDIQGSGIATLTDLTSNTITVLTAIQPNTVELGTQTTGNYVLTVNGGTGINVGGIDTEGSTKTVSLAPSGVVAGGYGTSTLIPTFVVDTYGRITSVSNVSIVAGVSSVAGATGDISNTTLLEGIKTVDGAASGLDADLLDGQQGTYYLDWTNTTNKPDPYISVTLIGDVQGSGNVILTDLNSGNITIATTIGFDSVALGIDTTGNYVQSITNGSYLTGGDGGSEGAALTLAVDATPTNTASKVVARDASGNFSAGTITASLVGNASTASALQTARTIFLAGDVTGSALFDGSANATITATIAANSIALGTDTTGNYVQTVTASTGILVDGIDGEGSTKIVSLATSGVDAGNYGSISQIPVLSIDAYGRITSAANVSIVAGVSSVAGATGAVSNTSLLEGIKTVDGANSGLDADLLDGQQGSYYYSPANPPPGGGISPWELKTANYTAVSGDRIIADTSLGSFTITLPATPSTGDEVTVADGADFNTANLTIARNGSTIEGSALDLILDIGSVIVNLIYDGTTWEVFVSTSGNELPSQTGNAGKYLYTDGNVVSWQNVTAGASITDDTTTDSNLYYPTLAFNQTTGTYTNAYVSSTKYYFNPSTGQLNATTFNSLSDINKKKDIVTITNALEIVSSLRGVRYKWKDTDQLGIGVIAQEIEIVIPEVVNTSTEGEKSVSYGNIVGVLIEAIKELREEVNKLKGL